MTTMRRHDDDLDGPDPRRPRLAAGATAGQRWRFRRNLVIYLAHRRNGLSQRLLADVFDLPRSRIAAIVREFDACERYGGGD
jgi:hypothetical protein